ELDAVSPDAPSAHRQRLGGVSEPESAGQRAAGLAQSELAASVGRREARDGDDPASRELGREESRSAGKSAHDGGQPAKLSVPAAPPALPGDFGHEQRSQPAASAPAVPAA